MLTQKLAQFVLDTPTHAIPKNVIESARNAAIDTLGCALAGIHEPTSQIAARWSQQMGSKEQVGVWGHNFRASPSEAAFVNAISSHALDFDDVSPSFRGHPSTSLFPVAMAVAEETGAKGIDILAAYAIGLEVGCKIGRGLGTQHASKGGWHPTATIGVLAATAVAARLWGLNAQALSRAWGMAASQMGGLSANFGTMTKPFHAGHAARCTVMSAWMAREGYTANETIFEGKKNLFTTYAGEDGVDFSIALDQLASPWELLDPGLLVKRWPCCYANHRAIGGTLQLMQEEAIPPETITEISVGFLPGSDKALVSRSPNTGLEAKFSIEYTLAALLTDGKLTMETYTDPMVQRTKVRHLMGKVNRYNLEGQYTGVLGYTDVNISTAQGKRSIRVDRSPGSPQWALSEKERDEKFIDCAALSLGTQKAHSILNLLTKFEQLENIKALVKTIAHNP